MEKSFRIGVDVGGTFTHAVALESGDYALLAKVKVPTTHAAPEGVALGITQALQKLLQEVGISPEQIGFVAHSTTQATNALLEGDVAKVGIIAVGRGLEGKRAQSQTRLGDIPLEGGRSLSTLQVYLETSRIPEQAPKIISELAAQGAKALVAAEAFSVDDPTGEQAIIALAASAPEPLPATGTHEVSGLYGLRIRTRTAALNASILPTMMEAAAMTESSVAKMGISAPLMVMRSDGGVMNLEQVRRRPLLTLLSGPAAGVAAALMFVRISDGVFLEVGGTSTDISLIRFGQSRLRSADIGGHRLFLRTLEVKTLGLGGGSMLRAAGRQLMDVGPRSAHIAGFGYCCFAAPEALQGAKIVPAAPKPGDPADYILLETPSGERFALTLTCAANAAGVLGEADYARGNRQSAIQAFELLAEYCGQSGKAESLAREALALAGKKAKVAVEKLIQDNAAPRESLQLVGGGGGAGVLVPETAREMHLPHTISPHTEVISAIGVAMALVRESIERTLPNPSPEDLLRIRREVEEGAARSGAAAETITVEVEVDPLRNIVRATASGATELRARKAESQGLSEAARREIAAASLHLPPDKVEKLGEAGSAAAFGGELEKRGWLGLSRSKRHPLRLLDGEGIIRLQLENGLARSAPAAEASGLLRKLLEEYTSYGDAGPTLPKIFLVARERITNLTGLASAEQALSLAGVELNRLTPEEPIMILIGR
jgi:N-methylhydantoinase A